MPKRVTDYRQSLLESLADQQEAAFYLEAALEDSKEMFLRALRDVAESRQMSSVAKEAGVAREALYRMLSESGNPTFATLNSILNAVGVRLRIAPNDGIAQAIRPVAFSDDSAISSLRTKLQTDQRIATKPLLDVVSAQRKPPVSETVLAMSGSAMNKFANQGNTDRRGYRRG